MEYIEGRTLDKLLKEQGRLGAGEALRIVAQAALALEHAHNNRIIHRDIKPSNIILDGYGNVKVMDFGLARITGERSRLTQSGTLMGTLDYMSPEQCRGEELDAQTDVYSLGVVLYEMLAGRPPFDAPNEAALINRILHDDPPELTALDPDVPQDVADTVARAMSRNKDGRYATIAEFLEDLRRLESIASSSAGKSKASPSIAVLPFVDMSPQKDQEYFCDGIAEELINALTQLKDLHVVARTSAFSFKGRNVKIRDIGRELNVETVLEGSVRKAGNRLRITAQLVKVDDGYHLWSEKYDRDMEDIFAIQDEISEAIVDRLRPRLLTQEKLKLARRQTIDLEAYNVYLQGRYFWNKIAEDSLKKALAFFERAIDRAPDYAAAYAGIADCYNSLAIHSLLCPRDAYPKALAAAQKALEIDDSLADAHASLGIIKSFYDYDWQGAEVEFRRAIELNPGYAFAHFGYGTHLRYMERFDEAIREVEQALELDPLSLLFNRELGHTLYYAGEYDRAIEALKKTIEMDPAFPLAHLVLAVVYLAKSMYDEAMAEIEKEKSISTGQDLFAEAAIGITYGYLGKRDEVQKILRDILQQSQRRYVPPTVVAMLCLGLGENDRCFEWLDRAYEERDPHLRVLKVGALFAPVRSDPRYIALLKKIGLDT
jgi:serine/threonine-protein kinase